MLTDRVGAGDAVDALVEGYVGRRDLELGRRKLLALLDDLLRRGLQPRAVADQRARAEGADADKLRRRGLVVAQLDAVLRDAQHLGDQHRKHCLVALP